MTTGPAGLGDACPVCGATGSRVTDSRPYVGSPGWRRRRRRCAGCGHAWTTLEMPREFGTQFRVLIRRVGEARALLAELDGLMRGLGVPALEDDDDGQAD